MRKMYPQTPLLKRKKIMSHVLYLGRRLEYTDPGIMEAESPVSRKFIIFYFVEPHKR